MKFENAATVLTLREGRAQQSNEYSNHDEHLLVEGVKSFGETLYL